MRLTAATARLTAALVAGLAMAWLIGACGSGGAGTIAKQTGDAVSTAVAQVTSSSTSTDAPPTKTTTSTETRTVTEPAHTVTRTETVKSAAPTTSVANQTTSVQVSPTSTSGGQTGDQVPWWGWLLIGLGAAAVAVGIFAAGHQRGAHAGAGSKVSGGPASGPGRE